MALTDKDLQKIKSMLIPLATREDINSIRADMKGMRTDMEKFVTKEMHEHLERTVDEIADTVNRTSERVSRLMTKEEAIHLFDVATMKTELDHIKRLVREKWGVEV